MYFISGGSAFTPLTSSRHTESLMISRQRLISAQLAAAKADTFTVFLRCLVLHSMILQSVFNLSFSALSDSTLAYLQLQHLTVHSADIISSCSTGTSTSSIFPSTWNFILLTFRLPAKKEKSFYLMSRTVQWLGV